MHRFLLSALIALIAGTNGPSAHAVDRAGQFSLGAGLGFVSEAPWAKEAFREAVSAGPSGTVYGRWHYLSHNSGLELSLDYFRHGGGLSSRSLIGSYFWRFDRNGFVHPLLAFGIGHSWTKNYFRTGDYNTAIFRIRLGAEMEIKPKWDLALHLDHYTIFKNYGNEPNLVSIAPTISVIHYFGDFYPPEAFEAAREGKPYPDVPVPLIPPPAATVADADGDGIPDAQDRCENTPTGVKANKLGCGPEQRFNVTLALSFPFQKADFPKGGDASLAEVVELLRDNPQLFAEVQGHTDTQGTEEQNDRLSRHRAEVVRERLIRNFQISAGRLRAKGYGSRYPIAASSTPEQHARNRRVVVRFYESAK